MTDHADPVGLIAILRGLPARDAAGVADVLQTAGMRILEVPLNSPDPAEAIRVLRGVAGPGTVVGAGTVLTASQVAEAHEAGAQMIVSPTTDTEVIGETVRRGLWSVPGAATPTEAFRAVAGGTRTIKVFPSDQVGVAGLRAWLGVLPPGIQLLPVGGVTPDDVGAWVAAGATGFGIGSALYRPGRPLAEIAARATEFVDAWHAVSADLRELP